MGIWGKRAVAGMLAVLLALESGPMGVMAFGAEERGQRAGGTIFILEAETIMDAAYYSVFRENEYTEGMEWLDSQEAGDAYKELLGQGGVYYFDPDMDWEGRRNVDFRPLVCTGITAGEGDRLTGEEEAVFLLFNDNAWSEDIVLKCGDFESGSILVPGKPLDSLLILDEEWLPEATPSNLPDEDEIENVKDEASGSNWDSPPKEDNQKEADHAASPAYEEDSYRVLESVVWEHGETAVAVVVPLEELTKGITPAAAIGSTEYSCLTEAIELVADGETIEVLRDVKIPKFGIRVDGFASKAGCSYTLDLNRHRIQSIGDGFRRGRDRNRGTITIQNGNLKFRDYLFDVESGNLLLKGITSESGSIGRIDGSGSVTIEGGNYTQNNMGYAFYINGDEASLNILNGEFYINGTLFEYNEGEKILIKQGFFQMISDYTGPWQNIPQGAIKGTVEYDGPDLESSSWFRVFYQVEFYAEGVLVDAQDIGDGLVLAELPSAPPSQSGLGQFLGWYTADGIQAEAGMVLEHPTRFEAAYQGMTRTVIFKGEYGTEDVDFVITAGFGTMLRDAEGSSRYASDPDFKEWRTEDGEAAAGDTRIVRDMTLHPYFYRVVQADSEERLQEALDSRAARIELVGDIEIENTIQIESYEVTIVSASPTGKCRLTWKASDDNERDPMFEAGEGGVLRLENLIFEKRIGTIIEHKGDSVSIVHVEACETGESGVVSERLIERVGKGECRTYIEGGYYKSTGTLINNDVNSYLSIDGGDFISKEGLAIVNYHIADIAGGRFEGSTRAISNRGRCNFVNGTEPKPYEGWENAPVVEVIPSEVKVEFFSGETRIVEITTVRGEQLPSWPEDPADGTGLPFYGWQDEEGIICGADTVFQRDTILKAAFGNECILTFKWELTIGESLEEDVRVARGTLLNEVERFRVPPEGVKGGFLGWTDESQIPFTGEEAMMSDQTITALGGSLIKDFDGLKAAAADETQVSLVLEPGAEISVTEEIIIEGKKLITGGKSSLNRAQGFDGHLFEIAPSDGISDVRMMELTVDGNRIEAQTAAILVQEGASLSLEGCQIIDNHNRGYGEGGGIHNEGRLSLSKTLIAGNQAESGGGIRSDGSVNACLEVREGSVIEGNRAEFYGGGIYSSSRLIVCDDSQVRGNHADKGGGIYSQPGMIEMYGGASVYNNTAASTGGGMYISAYTATLLSGNVYDNLAEEVAGDDVYRGTSAPSRTATHITPPVSAMFKLFETQPSRRYGDGSMASGRRATMVVPLPYPDAPLPDDDMMIPYCGWFADDTTYGIVRYRNIETGELVLNESGNPDRLDQRLEGNEFHYGLKAIWQGFLLLYEPNGGAGAPEYDPTAYPRNGEAFIAESLFARQGWEFTGWNTMADGSGSAYEPGSNMAMTGSVALYAQWEKKEPVSVTYRWVSVENPRDVNVPEEHNVLYKGNAYTALLQMPTAESYEFHGWYTDESCTIPYTDGTPLTGDLILYGRWEKTREPVPVRVAVTYEWVTEQNPTDVSVPGGDIIKKGDAYTAKPQTPTGQRYQFYGWYNDRECQSSYVDGTRIREDKVLYGKWVRKSNPPDDSSSGDNGSRNDSVENRWSMTDGMWYLFDGEGRMLTGWQFIGNTWYYLHTEEDRKVNAGIRTGAMLTGWYYDPVLQKWFYLDASGAMVTGWKEIGQKWYYFNPVSDGTRGAMMTDCMIDGWYVDIDGVWIP